MAMRDIPKPEPKYETVCKPEDVEILTKIETLANDILKLAEKFPSHDEKLRRYKQIVKNNAQIIKEITEHKAECFKEFVDIPKVRAMIEDMDEHFVNIEALRRRI